MTKERPARFDVRRPFVKFENAKGKQKYPLKVTLKPHSSGSQKLTQPVDEEPVTVVAVVGPVVGPLVGPLVAPLPVVVTPVAVPVPEAPPFPSDCRESSEISVQLRQQIDVRAARVSPRARDMRSPA